MLVDKIKYISSYEKYKDIYNKYSNELFTSLGQTIPYDSDEILIKVVPLSKIESKFTEVFCNKILLVTNKKIIELNSEIVDKAKVSLLLFNRMKKVILSSKSHKIQFFDLEGNCSSYSSINAKVLFELVRICHAKDCMNELEVVKH